MSKKSLSEIVEERLSKDVGVHEGRVCTNWVIDSVTASLKDDEVYVNATVINLDQIVFFDTLVELEQAIKRSMRGSWNFCLKQVSQRTDKVKFSFLVPIKDLVK